MGTISVRTRAVATSAVVGGLVIGGVSATAAPSGTDEAVAATAGTAIVIDTDDVLRPISRDLFGFNHRYENDGMFGYDSASDRMFPAFQAAVTDAAPTVLRYPGGTTANPFRWKEAIGRQSARGCQLNGVTAAPAASTYGVDEHARFAEQVGGTTNIVANFDTGTPAEAADWVEYMNTPLGQNPNGGTAWAQVRADNGHPEPYRVTWWELGNEVAGGQTWLGALPANQRSAAYAFGGSPVYTGVGVGTPCDQRATASRSDGTADQTFVVRRAPVVADSQTVYVGGTAWSPVSDLAAAGPADRVYELDPVAGRITFGDGTHGAVPANGQRISIDYTSERPGYVDFYQAMKAVDPDIRLCWAAGSYTVIGDHPLDCVVSHPYTFRRPSTDLGVVDTHDWVMARADQRGAGIANNQAALQRFKPGADLALTEYSMFFTRDDAGPTPAFLRSLDQGLYTASALTHWIDAGVPLAQKHPLLNPNPDDPPPGAVVFPSGNASAFGFYPTFVPQATAHVMNLFSHLTGTSQVAASVVNGPVHVGDTGQYPALRVIASTDDDGRLSLIVVNRDPQRDVTAAVLPERFRYRGDAEMWTVDGDSLSAHNTPADPDAVNLTKRTVDVAQGGFDHTFPAHSVTAIRLGSAGVPTADPVSIDAGGRVTVEAGGQVESTVTITNIAGSAGRGLRHAAGDLSVLAPPGWDVGITPATYTLAPGQSTTATVTITAPEDATDGVAVVVAADQGGEVADTGVVDVDVTVPFEPVFTDTFDADPVGDPPPDWTTSGPGDGITVQPDDSSGNVLRAQRTVVGTTPITAQRPFPVATGDVRLSYRIRADQTNQGFAVQLVDTAGTPVLRFNVGAGGVFKYSRGSSVVNTTTSYTPGTWYDIELVYHAATASYEAFVDDLRVAEAARWPGGGAPASVDLLIGPGNTGIAGYSLDDVTVEVPAP